MLIFEHGWTLSLFFLILPLFSFFNFVSSGINSFILRKTRQKIVIPIIVSVVLWAILILFAKRFSNSDYSLLLGFFHQNLYTTPTLFYLLPQLISLAAIKFFKPNKKNDLFSRLVILSCISFFFLLCLNYLYGMVYSSVFNIAPD